MTDASTCLCCGKPLPAGTGCKSLRDRRKGLRGAWCLAECAECGSSSIIPTPTDAELAEYYAAYTTEGRIEVKTGHGSHFPVLRMILHYISGDVDPRDFVEISPASRVLDYGCGQGSYLRYFHERGIDIHGAEVTDTLVDATRMHGLSVKKVTDFSSLPFADAEFDVVYLMQVFEHLRDPKRFMRELSRVLKRGGALYLAVPNASSTWRRLFRSNWVSGYFVPFHLVNYTDDALANLGSEYGFRRIRNWSRTPDSWFRLNLKAMMYPRETMLDSFKCWIDIAPMRILLIIALRLCEVFFRERDCLVMRFEKV